MIMRKTIVVKITAASLMLGVVMVGCTTGRSPIRVAGSGLPKNQAEAANRAAQKADAALKARDAVTAVTFAEVAVLGSPRDAGYRAILGQAYLLAGRFASAEAAFGDALSLVPTLGRASLSQALAQVAQGRNDAAHATLDGITAPVPAADLGLAYALAGDTEKALSILEPAARDAAADAKARQNYALALALAGRWAEAKATAAIDVAPADLDERMAQWAAFTRTDGTATQVAGLLGVTPFAGDPGQPVQLALAPQAAEQALAQADPATQPEAVEAETVIAAVEPVAVEPSVSAPVETAATDFSIVPAQQAEPFHLAEARRDVPRLLRAVATPASFRAAAAEKAAPRATGGDFVVQLGAFSTANRVGIAWERAMDRFSSLSTFDPASTTYVATERQATFYRLSISGFASHERAAELCGQIRSGGGECFVRKVAGDRPMQWAARNRKAAPAA